MKSIYMETRNDLFYMNYIRSLLNVISLSKKSILDVGSNGMDIISMTHCEEKVSIDINTPLILNGVKSIKANFLEYDFKRKFDIVTCMQVIEHISHTEIKKFCKKLLDISQLLIISVPYRWEAHTCPEHIHDPVDLQKLISWFNDEPKFIDIVVDNCMCRLIAIFYHGENFHYYKKYSKYIDNIFSSRFDKQTIDNLKNNNKKLSQSNPSYELSIVQLQSKIEQTTNIEEKIALYEDGIRYYPYFCDDFGHPVFFKEKIRLLLELDKTELAKDIYKNTDTYQDIYNKKELHILFRRKGIDI